MNGAARLNRPAQVAFLLLPLLTANCCFWLLSYQFFCPV